MPNEQQPEEIDVTEIIERLEKCEKEVFAQKELIDSLTARIDELDKTQSEIIEIISE